jgi:hypothetical protein
MTILTKFSIFALFLGAVTAHATTYNAVSCNLSDVQSAYATEQASKADGDVIAIPSCASTTWSSSWTISPTNTLTIQGNTAVAGTCAPGGSCTPTDNTKITFGNGVTFNANIASGKTFRLTGLSVTLSGSTAQYGSLNFSGATLGAGTLRIDHNHFNDNVSGEHTLQPTDLLTGLIDHNYFDSSTGANLFFIQPSNNGSDGESNATWTVAENFGTSASGWLYVENNYFQNGTFDFDCDFGARIAFRYNISWYTTRIQTHGTGSGAQRRGCRAMEIYGNTFTFSNSPNTNSFSMLVDYEGGPLMFWGNTVTGFSTLLREQEVRANTDTYGETATPGGWGYCGTSYNGAGSNWDHNTNSATGYPCLDQVGWGGAGQLLIGSFPNLVNNSTGTIAWPNQVQVPTYAWANTQVTNSYGPNHFWGTWESPARVTNNVDYYIQLPNVDNAATFNGTAGTGSGTLASRPSTCTTGVAYWATDQGSWNQSSSSGQLFKCTAANTWALYYTPYAYPHPLTGTTASPTPPTNLNGQAQ